MANSKKSKNCCCVWGCSNYPLKTPQLSFHTFPKDGDRRQIWISAVKRDKWQPSNSSVICSEHFSRDCYQKPPGLGDRAILRRDAIPKIFPTYPSHLQPTQPKKRRLITKYTKDEPATSAACIEDEPTRAETSTEPAVKRGRPKEQFPQRLLKLSRRVGVLKVTVNRLKRKAVIQKNLLKILQTEKQLQQAELDSMDGVLGDLLKNHAPNKGRKTNRRYSEGVKRFSLTLYYYSPRAYAYLRTVFVLPNPRSLRRWLECIDCNPGFFTDLMKNITADTAKSATPGLFSLVIDSMSIRKRLIVERSQNCLLGYTTIGHKDKLASEALVFLLVPIAGRKRYPIGYFLVDKIDSTLQTQLIKQCLLLTAENDIKIVNITCDGCAANISTLEKLGASIPDDPRFKHPALPQFVHVTLDAVHMLKLARNSFGSLQRFQSADGLIDYRYIQDLVALQDEMGLRLANKLTKRHLRWQSMKMKVGLAAQMLSSSVADSLEYLQKTDENFKDAGPTIKFIRQIDRLFDLLNCHNPYGKRWKGPTNRSNLPMVTEILQETAHYLKSLTLLNGRLISKSKNKTFVIGFQTAITSFLRVCSDVFKTYEGCKYILSYKLSQDHIETLFSKIRARGGFNNNPDVLQFRAAMKWLLSRTEITPSVNANCIELNNQGCTVQPSTPDCEEDGDDIIEPFNSTVSLDLSKINTDIIEYIAGYVARSLKLTCSDCINDVSATSDDPMRLVDHSYMMSHQPTLIMVKNRGGLFIPSVIVHELSMLTEQSFRRILAVEGFIPKICEKVTIYTLSRACDINISKKFTCAVHCSYLIRLIIQRYAVIRARHETKNYDESQTRPIRSRLNRLIIFNHV